MAELADAQDSKSCAPCGHEGSTPSFGTNKINHLQEFDFSNPLKKGMTLPVTLPVTYRWQHKMRCLLHRGLAGWIQIFSFIVFKSEIIDKRLNSRADLTL